MEKSAYKIHIIGAGISGLIAAQILENHGYHPTIIEASSAVGGRVKSDVLKGYTLDRGFQVLLTSYPAAKKYLNYDALELQELLRGGQSTSELLNSLFSLIAELQAQLGRQQGGVVEEEEDPLGDFFAFLADLNQGFINFVGGIFK